MVVYSLWYNSEVWYNNKASLFHSLYNSEVLWVCLSSEAADFTLGIAVFMPLLTTNELQCMTSHNATQYTLCDALIITARLT